MVALSGCKDLWKPVFSCRLAVCLAALAFFATSATGQIVPYYWSGDGVNSDWGTAGNFKSATTGGTNLVPASDSKTQLIFGARAAGLTTANNLTTGFVMSGITFESTTDSTMTAFTITGSQVEFAKRGSTNPFITLSSSQSHTISAPIKLADPLTLTGNGTGLVTLSGAWEGATKGIAKTGTSNFLITNDATTGGTATISGGTLALSGSGALAQIQLRGGVIAQSGTFSRALGTGASNVNFGTGGGGFAAYGGNLTVSTNLGTWGSTTDSLSTGTALILGSNMATGVVTLSQNLDLNSTGTQTRTITLADNANSSGDRSRISGIVSNSGGTANLTFNGTGRIELAGANSYNGTTTVGSGVTVNLQNNTALGSTAAGTTVSSGGAVELQGGITTGAEALNISGTGISNGGALRNVSGNNSYAGAVTLGANARINSDADTLSLTHASAIAGSGNTLTVGGAGNVAINSGIATGTGGLTKDGTGTLTLAGTSSYTGNTVVNGGSLLVNGSTAAGSAVTVGDASGTDTIGGTGTIGGATTIQNGGRITGATAGTVGTLTISNNLTMNAGSTWLVDLVGASADRLQSIVNLNINGAGFALSTQSPSWTLGDTWTIAQFTGSRTGTFSGLSDGATFFAGGSGGQFQINYEDELGAITITAVPETSTMVALCLLLVGCWFGPRSFRNSRKRKIGEVPASARGQAAPQSAAA